MAISEEICRRLQCIGVCLGGDSNNRLRSDRMVYQRFIPLDHLLPHASAIVHHGGIGTAAAAIEYGIPQLIIPRVFMQPWNAHWLKLLRVCRVLDPKSYTADEGTAALRELMTNPKYARAAKTYAARCNPAESLRRVCAYFAMPNALAKLKLNAL